MASIKKAISKVVSHTRSSSKSSTVRASTEGDSRGVANGSAKKGEKHATFDDTSANGKTAAQKHQKAESKLHRPNSISDDCSLSFTEQKEDRRAERELKEEEEARARKERMRKAHEEVRSFRLVSEPRVSNESPVSCSSLT